MGNWIIVFHPEFYGEFIELSELVQDHILAKALLLEQFGSHLGRPHVDTLYGSRFPNMKELRIDADLGTWRVAFAFDPERKAVLLVGGDKIGLHIKSFYRKLIRKADQRFDQHLKSLHEK